MRDWVTKKIGMPLHTLKRWEVRHVFSLMRTHRSQNDCNVIRALDEVRNEQFVAECREQESNVSSYNI